MCFSRGIKCDSTKCRCKDCKNQEDEIAYSLPDTQENRYSCSKVLTETKSTTDPRHFRQKEMPPSPHQDATLNANAVDSDNMSQSYSLMRMSQSKLFIARLKKTLANRPHAFKRFLDLAMKVKAKEIDMIGWTRHVLKLLHGHNIMIFGFFSFLPDTNEREIKYSCVVQALRAAPQDNITQIIDGLVECIATVINDSAGPLDFNAILGSLHECDPRFEYVFPTVDYLWTFILGCYHMAGENCMANHTQQIQPGYDGDAETRQWVHALTCLADIYTLADP